MTAPQDRASALVSAWQAELPDVLDATTELSKRIMLLAADLDEATRRELPEFGLTPAQFGVLVALRRAGAPYRLKPTELSRALLLSSGGTSNVTNHLVAEGLAERLPDQGDGRGTLISLTPRGVQVAEDAVRANAAAHAEIWRGAPAAAIEAATLALREIAAATEVPRSTRRSARGSG
ncbi:MarR family winged helix-turn-helix transcriptional regulator [Embleya scabrispora]|uniref:MarR family winged helix-turn-helix transcriptional regulator n=1 Tax=Embleya scabrispora TaxID=159449 RepID=UPI00036D04ED|nr:MarR family transcriptional regulator [Embleya scabrispora]MYS87427.1 MarR family transcriptional regulator [Streptomyces sp. SID5474]